MSDGTGPEYMEKVQTTWKWHGADEMIKGTWEGTQG